MGDSILPSNESQETYLPGIRAAGCTHMLWQIGQIVQRVMRKRALCSMAAKLPGMFGAIWRLDLVPKIK